MTLHRIRVIPILLLRGKGLVKTVRFKEPTYVGDPINAIRIFNEKEVDELVFLDIEATPKGREPDLGMLRDIASECFMPLCYGGGLKSLSAIEQVLKVGVEKVALNTALAESPDLVRDAARRFGSSTVVGSIDYRRSLLGKAGVCTVSGTKATGMPLRDAARRAEDLGVGELLLTAIDREGTMSGYDLDGIRSVAESVSIPVIANGGARGLDDFRAAVHEGKASAVAAGSLFVFVGRHRAVLITYPSQSDLRSRVYA